VKVWVHSIPPNVLGVYSSEEKSEEAKQEMDDDLYTRLDVWIWEVDGEEVEE
jgi:hypothetical protein